MSGRGGARASKRAKAQQKLVVDHMWIVETFVAKYRAVHPTADLHEAGVMGLVEAAARFDTKRKLRFSTYAWNWVRGHVLAEVRKSHVVVIPDQLLRQSRAKDDQIKVHIGNIENCNTQALETLGPMQDHELEERARQTQLEAALRALPPAERIVVKRTLAGDTTAELAGKMGLAEKRVREILGVAQQRLAEALGR